MSENRKIIVSKFGGTSMGSSTTMKSCAKISGEQKSSVIVLSATSGTTNLLLELAQVSKDQNSLAAQALIDQIIKKHQQIADELRISDETQSRLDELFDELQSLSRGIALLKDASQRNQDALVSLGERISSLLFFEAYQQTHPKQKIQWVDARLWIITDHQFGKAKPQISEISNRLQKLIPELQNTVYITQGFIGSTLAGQTTTLGRGGSDFSAALIAEGLGADALEIWTDVAGIATTDPRLCKTARLLTEISFTEASELATFGAKVLHPATLLPVQRKNIPVFVGSSFSPEQPGTWVKKSVESSPLVRALALRKNQSLVTLTTPQMWQSSGFLFQIFQVFHDYKISVDAVTTSEISVAVTLDSSESLSHDVIQKLSEFADVQIEKNLSLVSLIGNNINHTAGLAEKAFQALPGINVRMICQGASRHNFCFLVSDSVATEVIQNLHHQFIDNPFQEMRATT